MKTTQFVLLSALIGVSTAAFADYDGSRDERMKSALDNYHNSKAYHDSRNTNTYRDSRNPNPGPAARAEESVKRGAHNAGQAIKRGAQKAGHAVGTGVHKTGQAIDNAGEKMQSKTTGQ